MNDKIETLGLKKRTVTALHHARIKTITTLMARTDRDLRKIFGLGRRGRVEIERALMKRGLKLKTAARPRAGQSLQELTARVTRLERMMSHGVQEQLPLNDHPPEH